MSYHLYRFGDSQVLPLGDPLNDVAGADVDSDAVAVAGGVHYSYGSKIIPARLHTITHRGIYSNNVETNVDAMMALLGQRLQLWRKRESDDALQYKWARLVSARWRRDVNQSQHAVMNLQFEANGNWTSLTGSTASRTGGGSLATSPSGDAWILNSKLTFTASSSTTHTFRIQDTTNGIDVQWSGSVTSGEDVVIDAGTWTVTNDGADAYSDFTVNSAHTAQRWIVLDPDGQTFTITLSAGAGTFEFSWSEQWV